jgi:hypothetical protein
LLPNVPIVEDSEAVPEGTAQESLEPQSVVSFFSHFPGDLPQ